MGCSLPVPLPVSPHCSITFLVAVGNPASRALYNGLLRAILSLVYTPICTPSNCPPPSPELELQLDRGPIWGEGQEVVDSGCYDMRPQTAR